MLESLLAAQAVAFILCGSHPPRVFVLYKKKKEQSNDYSFSWWKRVGSSFAREFACYASRRIYIVWFSSTPSFVLCKRKKSNQTITLLAGGRGWIRTTEVIDDRFTVCSLWPLGNSSTIGAGERTRTPDLLITNQLLYQLSYTSVSPTP